MEPDVVFIVTILWTEVMRLCAVLNFSNTEVQSNIVTFAYFHIFSQVVKGILCSAALEDEERRQAVPWLVWSWNVCHTWSSQPTDRRVERGRPDHFATCLLLKSNITAPG